MLKEMILPAAVPMPRSLILLLALLTSLPAAAATADWTLIARDGSRTVELDRASVMNAERGSKVAWGRVVLGDAQAARAGYKSVRALNRYDCSSRAFTIVKRVYLSASDEVLHEEQISNPVAAPIRPGTADERFFNTVCPNARPSSSGGTLQLGDRGTPAKLQALAREAEQRAAAASSASSASARPVRARPSSAREAEPAPAHAPAPAQPRLVSAPPATQGISSSFNEQLGSVMARQAAQAAPRPATRGAAKPAASAERPAPAAPVLSAAHPHGEWSYSGDTGPAFWGELSPAYASCRNGLRQSPIDIRDGIVVDQEPLLFDYKPSYFRIVDNGHTIQVNYGPGSRLSVMGRNFELQQLHFHRPAEERIDGRSFEMGAHLVHRDSEGRLAVLAILFEAGAAHPLVQTLWNNLPLERYDEFAPRTPIQIADLLPRDQAYFSFMGSLTTPPCSEGVLWLVLRQPVQLSAEQMAIFARFYANNARPTQPANGRVIKESR